MIKHYIEPHLGSMQLVEITAYTLEKYYQMLLTTPAVKRSNTKKHCKGEQNVTPATVRRIHSLLRSALKQAEKWELIGKNPARYATVPKHDEHPQAIWDAPTLFRALECCQDKRLKLCMNLAFACSLRLGELLGLTWDCVDVSEESIQAGSASIRITKALQRVNKEALKEMESKDTIVIFPEQSIWSKSVLVLKKPKTTSSIRKVFLPKTVAKMLAAWKMEQEATMEAIGSEYANYDLVIATPNGTPTDSATIRKAMSSLIAENNLPPAVFHSLRHTSITYKLKLSNGDIKAVQGDSGHAQSAMITDHYSHILDEHRRENSQLMEEAFYRGKGFELGTVANKQEVTTTEQQMTSGISPEQLTKMLKNPEVVKILQMLSKAIGA